MLEADAAAVASTDVEGVGRLLEELELVESCCDKKDKGGAAADIAREPSEEEIPLKRGRGD